MKYLLDTHAAIWLLEGNPALGTGAKEALAAEDRESVALCDISLLEIAMLHGRGRIELRPDARKGLEAFAEHLAVLPLAPRIASGAVDVALPHRDPFDRVIVATALAHGLVLVTKDRKLIDANLVQTLW